MKIYNTVEMYCFKCKTFATIRTKKQTNEKKLQTNEKFSQMNEKKLQTNEKKLQTNEKNLQTNEKQKNRKLLKTLQIQKQGQRGKIAIFIKKIRVRPPQKADGTVNNIKQVKLFTVVAIQIGKKHKKETIL